jgi:hypothetical protein
MHNCFWITQSLAGWESSGYGILAAQAWHLGRAGTIRRRYERAKPPLLELFRHRQSAGKSLTITVEINPPHEGEDRPVAGLFARDAENRIYLAHTGKVGGGRTGRGSNAFHA